ncbi:MAG: GAF domain-containing protein, partial [Anaerolineales bacterium]|nr:GAF domain-containing protein [Anaerolineales bacterium]
MDPNYTRPTTVHDQLLALSVEAGGLRVALQKQPSISVETIDGLVHLEDTLSRLGQKIESFEIEHGNLTALANIGQVVNSSLELDEVLRIVMDNIVRLTRAERGFLMLREASGEMVTKMARNWEKESINASELTVSRTIVQRVIDSGEPIVTTNAQDDQRFQGQESIVAFNLRSILCVPLKVKNDVIGVIYNDNRIRTGIFSDTERDLLVA